ncbi:Protein SDA1, variant 3 [Bonamia ostreae]|uniref:Protein SDA1 n=1 Tax=Bonamia ostreae TaxID=126728 RepID=A0ABV2AGY0_9EUKA
MTDFEELNDLVKNFRQFPENCSTDVELQLRRFEATLEIIKVSSNLQTSKISLPDNFSLLLAFSTKIFSIDDKISTNFPNSITELIENLAFMQTTTPEIRLSIAKSAIFLHNKNIFNNFAYFQKIFDLFNITDKALKSLIFSHLTNYLRNNKTGFKLSGFTKFLTTQTSSDNPSLAKKSLSIIAKLYIQDSSAQWRNAHIANIIANCCFSRFSPLTKNAAKFLLGEFNAFSSKQILDRKIAKERFSEQRKSLSISQKVNKRKIKRSKKLKKLKTKSEKLSKMDENLTDSENNPKTNNNNNVDFGPIRSLNDPLSFSEKLFKKLKNCRDGFEMKILLMKLLSRVLSCHCLMLPGFLSFLQRYLQPHQKNVSAVLSALAQSIHSGVEKEELEPVLAVLAHNFVTDRSDVAVMTIGLNTIREICSRQPMAMDKTMLADLCQYKTSHSKPVAMAAKGLLSLYRQVNPALLSKKNRGRICVSKEVDVVQSDSSDNCF